MSCIRPLLAGLALAASIAAADAPPPFGAVIQEWTMPFGGRGITWRRDSQRFHAMAEDKQFWSFTALDPEGSSRRENWVLPNMGSATADIPASIAWDNDSNCFWIANIVDGNVYGGCYYTRMRKSAVGDTWRWFCQEPGDTWLVGDGSAGGGGQMYWLAGAEKWLGRGTFAGAPVAPSPSTNNHIWRFDPYTKTDLGRLPNGSTRYERCLSLVPWDSCYIMTAGLDWLYKRDSTGLLLESVPGGLTDLALWAPRIIGPADTVSFYALCSDPPYTLQRVSVGMLWGQLPSAVLPNIRSSAILAPVGTIDSGRAVIPRLVVANTGRMPAPGVNVYLTIDAYGVPSFADSITGISLDTTAAETLAFSSWAACGRDTMNVTAWTSWPGDSFPEDDTVRGRFLVRVKDVAVTEITLPAPDTILDSGVVFHPQCWVRNYGNVPVTCDVGFRIGAWQSSRQVSLIPGGASQVAAPSAYTALPGIRTCRVFADLPEDLHPENNTKVDTFTVRGLITRDVEACAVLAPTGTVPTRQGVTPKARFGNNGDDIATFWTFFTIFDPGGAQFYAESSQNMVAPNDSIDVEYPLIGFWVEGTYTAVCSAAMDDDQNSINDVRRDTFRVAAVGVAGTPGFPPSFGLLPAANPCRDFAFLSFTGPLDHMSTRPLSLSLYNASGRLVLRQSAICNLKSEMRLDLRSLPSGVYVLRLDAGRSTSVQKVVLQH